MVPDQKRHKTGFLILLILIALLWWLGTVFPLQTDALRSCLEAVPLWLRGAFFITLYVIITFFFWLSKDFFRIMAAVLFGAYWSTLFVWCAELINACILFWLARYLGRDFVVRLLKIKHEALEKRLSDISFVWLFLFRATPLIPFRFLDLASGLTGMPFGKYMAAVMTGSLPRIFWLQYVLAGVGEVFFKRPEALVEYLSEHKGVYLFTFIYSLLVIVVAVRLKSKRSGK